MKCPNRNCIGGDIPELTSENEHLPLICPECQKRFCPSPLCGHRELDEGNRCGDCGGHFPEENDEEYGEDGSWKALKPAGSNKEGLEEFMKAVLKRR